MDQRLAWWKPEGTLEGDDLPARSFGRLKNDSAALIHLSPGMGIKSHGADGDHPSQEPGGGHGRGPNPANCAHFCAHLATPEPINPVRAGVCKPATASLLSSRSLVRIQRGAFCLAKRQQELFPCYRRAFRGGMSSAWMGETPPGGGEVQLVDPDGARRPVASHRRVSRSDGCMPSSGAFLRQVPNRHQSTTSGSSSSPG